MRNIIATAIYHFAINLFLFYRAIEIRMYATACQVCGLSGNRRFGTLNYKDVLEGNLRIPGENVLKRYKGRSLLGKEIRFEDLSGYEGHASAYQRRCWLQKYLSIGQTQPSKKKRQVLFYCSWTKANGITGLHSSGRAKCAISKDLLINKIVEEDHGLDLRQYSTIKEKEDM